MYFANKETYATLKKTSHLSNLTPNQRIFLYTVWYEKKYNLKLISEMSVYNHYKRFCGF